jgi:hypothetical protein
MLEEKIRDAIIGELQRQAANRPEELTVHGADDLTVNGRIDLAELVMVVVGSVAGGP